MEEITPITFTPIGFVESTACARYDAPRQGVLADSCDAVLRLRKGMNFEQAVDDLRGVERVWLLYVFHLNSGWKPRVNVPRHRKDKVGVFATRAPYRPNPIGLSCVRLLSVDGLTLHLAECDLLNGTPVLDIKPYLPYADSFPDAGTGWVPDTESLYSIAITPRAERQLDWLLREGGVELLPFITLQLEADPVKGKRKRIKADSDGSSFVLARRTWRIRFLVDHDTRAITVLEIFSCYSDEDMLNLVDPHEDKQLHRRFRLWNEHGKLPAGEN